MAKRKKAPNKGKKCTKTQMVYSKAYGKKVKRCAMFSGTKKKSKRKSSKRKSRKK